MSNGTVCWKCKRLVREEDTVCMPGVGTQCHPVCTFPKAMTPNWDAMTAEEIAAVIESAPVVLGEWYGDDGCTACRLQAPERKLGAIAVASPVDWTIRDPLGWTVSGTAPTREAAMAAADAAARERGWRLMGGE